MKNKFILVLIFLLAFVLRFWQLGQNPASLDWDEASLGYNAYSLLSTGKDEYGISWPLAIKSFGDYKPPLYTYFTMLPVAFLGLTEYSTRLISALFGFIAVIGGYFLIKELFPGKRNKLYLLFTFLFAISPWHIQFSRIAFEANLSLTFLILGVLFFLKAVKKAVYFPLSFLFFAFSAYAYHSPRLIIPILVTGLFIIYRKHIFQKKINKIYICIGILLFSIIVFPILNQFRSSTGARFTSVTVMNPSERLDDSIKAIEYDQAHNDYLGQLTHNRRIIFAKEIIAGYLDHFNFDFLFTAGDPPGRHHAVGMGMLYFWEIPFVLLGILVLLRKPDKSKMVILLWFLVAPLASALTTGTPHAVRALFYLPVYQIITTLGILSMLVWLKQKSRIIKRSILIILFSCILVNFFYYLHMYYIHTPLEYAQWWQYGYKEMIEEVNKIKGDKKVIVTYRYDQPYVYFLFYNKVDPLWYQTNWGSGEVKRAQRNFGDYEFRNIDWEKDSKLSNVVLVGTSYEIPADTPGVYKDILFPDQTVAFRIAVR